MKRTFCHIAVVFTLLLQIVKATKCPLLKCNRGVPLPSIPESSALCYKHSADDPVTEIKIEKCKDD